MKGRALIVDDDRGMVATLADILELDGWTAERAHSGEEALERARRQLPDVVVMDIKMGGMNSVETLRALRRLAPDLKVVLMTAFSAAELLEEAVEAGAVTVLPKPLRPNALTELLATLVNRPPRVLVVDDDPDFLTTLSDAVEQAGYEVVRAASLDEAVDRLAAHEVRVILLDMILPGSDPHETVVAIREASPSAAFIFFSGYEQVLERANRTFEGEWVRACLHKPFPIERLLEALRDAD